MRYIILFLLFIFLAPFCLAQEKSIGNVVKFNPLSLLVRAVNVSYERSLSDRYGFQVSCALAKFSQAGTDVKGNVVVMELKCYLNREALSGYYLSSFIKRQAFNLQDLNQHGTYVSYGPGVAFGRQRTYGSFALDILIGPGYNFGEYYPISGSAKLPLILSGLDRFSLRIAVYVGFGL